MCHFLLGIVIIVSFSLGIVIIVSFSLGIMILVSFSFEIMIIVSFSFGDNDNCIMWPGCKGSHTSTIWQPLLEVK